jgi:hypothetical protein
LELVSLATHFPVLISCIVLSLLKLKWAAGSVVEKLRRSFMVVVNTIMMNVAILTGLSDPECSIIAN